MKSYHPGPRQRIPSRRPGGGGALRRVAALALASLLLTSMAPAQDSGFDRDRPQSIGNPEFLRYGDLIYAEAVSLPSEKPDLCRIDVLVRVTYDFFVFTRSQIAHPDSLFSASFDNTIDILQKGDAPVETAIDQGTVWAPDYGTTSTRDRFVLFRHRFYLAPGRYRLRVTTSDRQSSVERKLEVPFETRLLRADKSLAIGSIIPLSARPLCAAPWSLLGFGGSVMFNAKAPVAVSSSAGVDARWSFTLQRKSPDDAPDTVAVWNDLPGTPLPGIGGSDSSGCVADFPLCARAGLAGGLTVFTLPTDTVDAGLYDLVIRVRDAKNADSLTQPFRVLWKDEPFSLRLLPLAISVMRYVLTDEQYDELGRGSAAEQERKLKAYWKSVDPTPGTIYNERMTEYFRRTDVAFFKYQTMNRQNGALTDRGKIHILYGEPEVTRRILNPDGTPEEIWEYPSLKKTFRFIDVERKGNYRLE